MQQRSRVDWLTDGDKNTRFFQLRASSHRWKNLIKSLVKDDGQVTEDNKEMECTATKFYKNIYYSEGVENMQHVLDTIPKKISNDIHAHLDAPIALRR